MDITRRLRAHALPDPSAEREVLHAPMLKEAADEIERLREALKIASAAAEALKKDAERYWFLRGDGGATSVRWPAWSVQYWNGAWNQLQGGPMDAAVDAARLADQPPNVERNRPVAGLPDDGPVDGPVGPHSQTEDKNDTA